MYALGSNASQLVKMLAATLSVFTCKYYRQSVYSNLHLQQNTATQKTRVTSCICVDSDSNFSVFSEKQTETALLRCSWSERAFAVF